MPVLTEIFGNVLGYAVFNVARAWRGFFKGNLAVTVRDRKFTDDLLRIAFTSLIEKLFKLFSLRFF